MWRRAKGFIGYLVGALLGICTVLQAQGQFLIGHECTDLESIPRFWIRQAASRLHVSFNFTCPGSHLVSGLEALASFPPYGDNFAWSEDGTSGLHIELNDIPCDAADLGQGDFLDGDGVTEWVTCTREYLDQPENAEVNVVIWAWCSGNGHDAQRYVDNMEILISEYPNVEFVFMTGHAQGQGEDPTTGSVHFNNELIRSHCESNGRVLFDFADIEAYNPDGEYFGNLGLWDNLDYLGGNWAEEWIDLNHDSVLAQLTMGEGIPGYSGCPSCAHSDAPPEAKLNCVLKARAAWWMFAALAGWNQGELPPPRRPAGRVGF